MLTAICKVRAISVNVSAQGSEKRRENVDTRVHLIGRTPSRVSKELSRKMYRILEQPS
jgi:hypothetical protein